MTDIEKLNQAVDEFALAMKSRLQKRATEGYTGWDKLDLFDSFRMRDRIIYDAEFLETADDLVDLANLAMFLRYAYQLTEKEVTK